MLGGSFNPPHIGHLALADAVHTELGFDTVLLVPTFISPLKSREGFAKAEERLEMLSLACEGSHFLSVCDCELKRGGVSYTVDTLRFIAESYGCALSGNPALIIGFDWVSSFYKWRRADEIVNLADIVIARRPGYEAPLAKMRNGAGDAAAGRVRILFPQMQRAASVIFADNIELAISSSDIRRRIAQGKSWRYLVPEAVSRYILQKGLYA